MSRPASAQVLKKDIPECYDHIVLRGNASFWLQVPRGRLFVVFAHKVLGGGKQTLLKIKSFVEAYEAEAKVDVQTVEQCLVSDKDLVAEKIAEREEILSVCYLGSLWGSGNVRGEAMQMGVRGKIRGLWREHLRPQRTLSALASVVTKCIPLPSNPPTLIVVTLNANLVSLPPLPPPPPASRRVFQKRAGKLQSVAPPTFLGMASHISSRGSGHETADTPP